MYITSSQGTKIAYHKISGKSPGIVFFGGFKSDMTGTKASYLESVCQRLGQAYVRFDYSGIASAPDFVEDLSHMQVVQEEVLTKNGICYLPSRDSVTVYPITPHLITEGRTHSLLKAPIPIFCPVHLLHGLSDKDVPWQKSVKLAERLQSANVTVTLIKNGDHRLSERTHLALLEKSVYSLVDEAR